MFFSCLSLVFYRFINNTDIWLLLFVFAILFFPLFIHDGQTRWSTIIYSCLFCFSYSVFVKAFHVGCFTKYDFLKVVKFLIYAYCFVLIIQQLSVLIGIEPINLRNYDPNSPFKLNTLGAEPSWSARIVALLFYCYITVKECTLGRSYDFSENIMEDRLVWFSFLWTMLTMISGTAFIFLLLVLFKFFRIKKLFLLAPLVLVFIIGLESSNIEPYERARDTVFATLTFDEEEVIRADHSASFRIVPMIKLFNSVGLTSFEDFFGHGVDSISNTIEFNLGVVPTSFTLLGVWYEYGFIAFVIIILFSLRKCVDLTSPVSLIFWFMLVFMYGLNTQIPWLAMMLLYMTKTYTHDTKY
jgi:hypothetical protein